MAPRPDKQRPDSSRTDKRGSGKGPGGPGRGSGGSRRTTPVAVKKPFPWGVVATSVVLGAALVGLLAYAATNQGSGRVDPFEAADSQFPGLAVTELDDLARDHVQGAVAYAGYPATPPVGGEHNGLPQQCAVYTDQIPPEHALHSLEHGAVWITYDPDLPADQVQALADEVDGDPLGLMSPLPGQESPIVLTAWGRQLSLDSVDDGVVGRFVSEYTNGPTTPERGASCSGNSSTGEAPQGAPAPAPVEVPVPDGEAPAPDAPAPAPAPSS